MNGVDFRLGKWRARISVNGKRTDLGRFSSEDEARAAYDRALAETGHQRVRKARLCRDPRERFFGKTILLQNGCVLWLGARDKDGYGKFQLNGDGRQQHVRAHRFAFYLAHGRWPADLVIHSCDTPACVNANHLRDGSQSDNLIDCAIRGRRESVRLNADAVRLIRSRHARGERITDIARSLLLPHATISSVVHQHTWKHVT